LTGDDELQPTDMDWEQLLAATFDPGDPAMFLGPDEMFSLNRNDVLYAQKYAAARTSSAAAQPASPSTAPAGELALNDEDLERCANDLDRFVNDLELACANIGQRGAGNCVGDDVTAEQSISNASGRDLDPDTDHNLGHVDNSDADQRQSPTSKNTDDCREPSAADERPTENGLQNSDDVLDRRQDSNDDDNSQRRVLCDLDLDPNNTEVNNGPEIALYEMTDDLVAVHRYPYDPDPEATVV